MFHFLGIVREVFDTCKYTQENRKWNASIFHCVVSVVMGSLHSQVDPKQFLDCLQGKEILKFYCSLHSIPWLEVKLVILISQDFISVLGRAVICKVFKDTRLFVSQGRESRGSERSPGDYRGRED